ncbi:phosphoribosylanthranilate isomerase [Paenibacillus phyllosphaerae]|uniref:N-(5'-phosphoribosyl)anthranilate isomerase n=1 Tax=Paenibacillus phyllosphaerae TaxID=274593 RepID=A0A7W5AV09_9BACL|nr:phosphoribosylanthranilate isomerase [Paenibacillus phyllosphaerae]
MSSEQTRVKICGLRDADTLQALDGLPIDQIGFVFAKSKRQVTSELAGELIAEVKQLRTPSGASPQSVGVFVNAQFDQLRELLQIAPLDVVQLHGQESPGLCGQVKEQLNVDVWKVLSVLEHDEQEQGHRRLYEFRGAVDAFLIDTAGGGTGHTFAWDVIPRYAKAAEEIGVPLYVAGGLHPDNVGELLGSYRIDGVDVSSGVETEGIKDISKIRTFVERVKR